MNKPARRTLGVFVPAQKQFRALRRASRTAVRGATAAARETGIRPTIGLNVDGEDTRCMVCHASEVVDEGSGFGLAVSRLVGIGEVPQLTKWTRPCAFSQPPRVIDGQPPSPLSCFRSESSPCLMPLGLSRQYVKSDEKDASGTSVWV